jgi:hypothetical protein
MVLAHVSPTCFLKGAIMSEAFDQLAKMVARGSSRRGVLKYLGGLLAGVFSAVLPGRARADEEDHEDNDQDEVNEAVNAACKKYCSSCPRRPEGVHGHCVEHCKKFLRKNPKGSLCGTCTVKNPFTGCVSGATCCTPKGAAAFCTNTGTDAKNCGACGNVCPTANPNCCSGKCTNTGTDAKNCGACGTVCATTKPTCCSGACTDTTTDAKNCGACGTACPTANPNCCAGKCTNTQTDNNNCGSCGNKCATGKTCKAGVCS